MKTNSNWISVSVCFIFHFHFRYYFFIQDNTGNICQTNLSSRANCHQSSILEYIVFSITTRTTTRHTHTTDTLFKYISQSNGFPAPLFLFYNLNLWFISDLLIIFFPFNWTCSNNRILKIKRWEKKTILLLLISDIKLPVYYIVCLTINNW